jgi:hypothetical protein
MPKVLRARSTRHRAASLAALAVLALGLSGAPASAEEPRSDQPSACVQRYHASLKRIAETDYQAVKAARDASSAAAAPEPDDVGLPGALLFPPTSLGRRTNEETAALRVVASLARSKGRASGGSDEDAHWMGDRLRLSLADYLTQKPSPYLCGGVEAYVRTLRSFASRLGMTPIQRERLVATQRNAAERAVSTALLAMKPVPAPAAAPAVRPPMGPFQDLRPAAGLERVDTSLSTGSTPAHPDLPPARPETLQTPADLVGAIDRLTAAAIGGGFITQTPNAMPIGGTLAVSPTAYPVLSRLAEARSMVLGRPLVSDRVVRLKLSSALAAVEGLDYLMRARTDGGDPLALAIDTNFEAILKAHAVDCTCRD